MKFDFWSALESYVSKDVFNPWRTDDPADMPGTGAARRRTKLREHFARDAKYLLIGEAPGYRGCHFSGIAFTCEKQLCDGIVPGLAAQPRLTTRPLPWSEGSATVIWETLYRLQIAESTVLWNAFAFHPHKPGKPMSNRAPTMQELIDNIDILSMVLHSYPEAKRIAVGRTAARTLTRIGFPIDHEVRHPSMGGATIFRQQMAALV